MGILMLLRLSLKPLQLSTEPLTRHGHICLTGMVNRAVVLALIEREEGGVGWNACFPSAWVFCLFQPPSFDREALRTFLMEAIRRIS